MPSKLFGIIIGVIVTIALSCLFIIAKWPSDTNIVSSTTIQIIIGLSAWAYYIHKQTNRKAYQLDQFIHSIRNIRIEIFILWDDIRAGLPDKLEYENSIRKLKRDYVIFSNQTRISGDEIDIINNDKLERLDNKIDKSIFYIENKRYYDFYTNARTAVELINQIRCKHDPYASNQPLNHNYQN